MEPETVHPRRPLVWPVLVDEITAHAHDPARLYMVGGMVRDALRDRPIHDIDLVTPDDGLKAARRLANGLGGAYYAMDSERRTGRAIVEMDGEETVIDVASFRGPDLLADLTGRDFTVNAIAVRLDQPDRLIDPLNGQKDLFDHKVLRLCRPDSISSDPIRTLRAVRHAIQFGLRMLPETRSAVRAAVPMLTDSGGQLIQPERTRDELFKLLAMPRPVRALRVMDTLGLLAAVTPYPQTAAQTAEAITLAERLHDLLTIISPRRDDNSAADLILGVAVMILDRFRIQLQEHLDRRYGDGRQHTALLTLSALTPKETPNPGTLWADHLRLSNTESAMLNTLAEARAEVPAPPVSKRAMHRYYRASGETGIDGVLLHLAQTLAAQPRSAIDPKQWGAQLEHVAAPLLDAFFRQHQVIVTPPPLVTGTDLLDTLGLKPGPCMGVILAECLEAQAAGELKTKKEALRYAERLAADSG